MKCQHCGINFDDGDRECPICGARAGSRGRLSVRRGASFRPHGSAAPKTTEPTILNGKVKKDRAAQKKKGREMCIRDRDLVVAAVNEALKAATEKSQSQMSAVTGGMGGLGGGLF